MVFNSIFFIFCFLPVFMLIYYLVPGKLRNLLLFLGSPSQWLGSFSYFGHVSTQSRVTSSVRSKVVRCCPPRAESQFISNRTNRKNR